MTKITEYQKEYRKTRYSSRKKVQDRARRLKHRNKAISYLGGECEDCGITDNRVLVFDHVIGDKECNVPSLFGKKWERVEKELDKCELVCANCHMIRTVSRIPIVKDDFEYAKPKTHCKRGHEFTIENTYLCNNIRYCKTCRKEYQR